ncbi:MAG: TRAP transporter small permease subunit [Deltaproteobacteria bacterium]|nr:TRAP transporter small permease subunit [Deltaproteobacteria bacterium]
MIEKITRSLDKALGFFEDWTLFITVMIALFALFINVVLRYGFNYCLAWSEELVRDVIIYTTFVGCSAAIRREMMIKVDATVQIFPKFKIPLTFFSNLTLLTFSVLLIIYGCKLTALQAITNQHSIIMKIPLKYLFAILPITGAMMMLRVLLIFYYDIIKLKENKTDK